MGMGEILGIYGISPLPQFQCPPIQPVRPEPCCPGAGVEPMGQGVGRVHRLMAGRKQGGGTLSRRESCCVVSGERRMHPFTRMPGKRHQAGVERSVDS